ncbi:VOC family protein [Bacillus sp. AFS017336]|uniref:VOC family protein n=1 Tax=Bacillus sp. AFS017336 TaxID=2033489 RepID=UPI000BF1860C|nr:VOC family protein [Bacillus sp. AFS017336]PEK98604.1 glyoxalase [Bacillus sp. AFS017336]
MKIKGFGGIFWRTNDIEALKKWYKETLLISLEEWNGTIIKPDSDNETIFSLFKHDSEYFPKEQSVMLNLQVDDLNEWVHHFNEIGVKLQKDPEIGEYGAFAWISDPDGRWIELWEKK